MRYASMLSTLRGLAVLAVTVLAACDSPATLSEKPFEPIARRAVAPVLTVSNSGGYPLISWSPLDGAISYAVVYRRERTVIVKATLNSTTEIFDTPLGSTSGSSFLDSAHPYTGKFNCTGHGTYSSVFTFYRYRVTATFADGTSATSSVNAPVSPC